MRALAELLIFFFSALLLLKVVSDLDSTITPFSVFNSVSIFNKSGAVNAVADYDKIETAEVILPVVFANVLHYGPGELGSNTLQNGADIYYTPEALKDPEFLESVMRSPWSVGTHDKNTNEYNLQVDGWPVAAWYDEEKRGVFVKGYLKGADNVNYVRHHKNNSGFGTSAFVDFIELKDQKGTTDNGINFTGKVTKLNCNHLAIMPNVRDTNNIIVAMNSKALTENADELKSITVKDTYSAKIIPTAGDKYRVINPILDINAVFSTKAEALEFCRKNNLTVKNANNSTENAGEYDKLFQYGKDVILEVWEKTGANISDLHSKYDGYLAQSFRRGDSVKKSVDAILRGTAKNANYNNENKTRGKNNMDKDTIREMMNEIKTEEEKEQAINTLNEKIESMEKELNAFKKNAKNAKNESDAEKEDKELDKAGENAKNEDSEKDKDGEKDSDKKDSENAKNADDEKDGEEKIEKELEEIIASNAKPSQEVISTVANALGITFTETPSIPVLAKLLNVKKDSIAETIQAVNAKCKELKGSAPENKSDSGLSDFPFLSAKNAEGEGASSDFYSTLKSL